MKYAVIGGAGFVGRHLTDYLLKNDHDVIVIDNLHNSNIENISNFFGNVDFHKLDILEKEKLKSLIRNVDGIFHHAALIDVQESFIQTKKYFDVNVLGTQRIFELAEELGLKTVFASSASIYGNPKQIPIVENSERSPLNPYGQTKLEGEYLAEKFSENGVSIIGLRYFNIYGNGQSDSYAGVITKFFKDALQKKPPKINDNGSQTRDFVYVGDVARANLFAMESKTKSGFINIGSGVSMTILELANIIIKKFGLDAEPIFCEPLKGEIKDSQASIELAKKLLNWEPNTALDEWLESQIKK
jgi:UDP-glucose 4-epimerase